MAEGLRRSDYVTWRRLLFGRCGTFDAETIQIKQTKLLLREEDGATAILFFHI